MSRPLVFVARLIPEKALQIIRDNCDAEVWDGELPPPYKVLRERAAQANGLLTLLTDQVDDELLSHAPGLQVVSNMAVVYDNVDVEAATRHGVLVTNTPGVLTETTADLAFALLMAAARRVVEGDRHTRQGKWKTWGADDTAGSRRPRRHAWADRAGAHLLGDAQAGTRILHACPVL